jgi:hypothetical protein
MENPSGWMGVVFNGTMGDMELVKDSKGNWAITDFDKVLIRYKTASLTPPEPPKKKTRKMTPLEMAYKQGARWVFRYVDNREGVWYLVGCYDDDYNQMAEILNEGRTLGEWVDCEVEVEE